MKQGMSHDCDRPVKGRRDSVTTSNKGARGGVNVHQSGNPSTDGYTKKGTIAVHSPDMYRKDKSGGEPGAGGHSYGH